jgi:N-acetylmuramoyl-L-alanine amidase
VQIFAINRMLRPGSEQFKGRRDVAYYKDGNVMKYTIGETANYDDIAKLRQKLLKDFPQCFVIAFKDGQRIDINKAIDEYRKRK